MFLLGGFLAFSLEPTGRNMDRIWEWIEGKVAWRQHLKRLEKKGLIEGDVGEGEWVGRITARGSRVFAGGRHPEERWNRGWDGKWRVLTFDLPRKENSLRMKLRRWLCAEQFGRLQGSVWVSPDPVPAADGVFGNEGVDASMAMVFEGDLAGGQSPREVSAIAWDFEAINAGYGRYIGETSQVLQQIRRKEFGMERIREVVRTDRKRWLEAVRPDPLLPKELLPNGYQGTAAWAERGKLMRKLGSAVGIT